MPNNSKSKVAFVSFYTEGPPFDTGQSLTKVAESFKSKYQDLFDYTIILTPSLLVRQDDNWKHILHNQEFIDAHFNCSQKRSSLNFPWINLNCMLWKPMIMSALLAETNEIDEGTIIIYHDLDSVRYPIYNTNFQSLSQYFRKHMQNCSIALVVDTMFPLYVDTKQEVLRKYLHSEAQTLSHRWAGCIAMKKDRNSREFCRDWCNLLSIDENRSQITKYDNFPGFIWHSLDQSMLSIVFYLWKYKFLKSRVIKSLRTPGRDLTQKWSPGTFALFVRQSVAQHSKYFFVRSIYERLLIAFGPRFASKLPNAAPIAVPNIFLNSPPND